MYETRTDLWREQLSPAGTIRTGALVALDTSVDRLIVYDWEPAAPLTYEFDLASSTWMDEGVATPEMGFDLVWGVPTARGEMAYDEARARTVIFSQGHAIAYDASAHAWQTVLDPNDEQSSAPGNRSSLWLVYDAVNERLLVVGGWHSAVYATRDLVAFDLGDNSWTVLVEPSAP